ncbi:mandelate racemase/muconate lactonizing enzyme family protein [Pollutimonas harenae]|uniref:Mandelate racemase/muconate lactonizing enzyme family protein n=1 Tax=Pollutimonas harenae TaxID=657015 RepID=A0A853GN49_9BURK|nr:mandelate racemase/muconate lactonizing enzyme family protein [Pollutimonas harenae]NYT84428.1 mandelate racemase/muconate lactonizing enzyme family protein [Pollutimonas harenae]TEA73171.1 mandelate racemase/muconate lactonizing enzyme family protein [Pollutimonas harenae]
MTPLPELSPIHVAKVEAFVYRAPVTEPVETSFGIMHDRPAVLVRIEDDEGAVGWGEIWCNFPGVGAEHRARILESCIAPILKEQAWPHPTHAFNALAQRLHVLGLQTGEPGTMAQAIAGADIAMWDLTARHLNQPLWKLLGGSRHVQVYASGLSPTAPEHLAAQKKEEGYRAFKLKVGFGVQRDLTNLRALRSMFGDDTLLMIDANQGWTPDSAIEMSELLAECKPLWLEEPIRVDHNLEQWVQLAKESKIPLAAGENMRGEAEFSAAIASGAFAVLQPDLGKWGGFSGCVPVGKQALAGNRLFCPHWLGGGVGLVASMHLKAAVGGDGFVEVDSNPNPLRDHFAGELVYPTDGAITLPEASGLGITPDLQAVGGFLVPHKYG